MTLKYIHSLLNENIQGLPNLPIFHPYNQHFLCVTKNYLLAVIVVFIAKVQDHVHNQPRLADRLQHILRGPRDGRPVESTGNEKKVLAIEELHALGLSLLILAGEMRGVCSDHVGDIGCFRVGQ